MYNELHLPKSGLFPQLVRPNSISYLCNTRRNETNTTTFKKNEKPFLLPVPSRDRLPGAVLQAPLQTEGRQ